MKTGGLRAVSGATRTLSGEWVLNLYRAMQAAIGQRLKIEHEPPRELTPELAIVLRKLDEPGHRQRTGPV